MASITETGNLCGSRSKGPQATMDGENTGLYILKDNVSSEIAITNRGGAIIAIMVPGKGNKLTDVIQGHDSTQNVIDSPEPCLSTLIGRYGNRIIKGKFHLHGKEYRLPINNGPDCLHGDNKGFNTCVWGALQTGDQTLVLKYMSPHGEEGFPGELRTMVVYPLNDDNELSIEYMPITSKKTIINLANHGFFSLPDIVNPTPTIENQIYEINADYYTPIDDTSISMGEIRFVEGIPLDFRQPKLIGQDIEADDIQIRNGVGYDHCFVLNKKEEGELSFTVRLTDSTSCRITKVYTTEPGAQLYTDNWTDGYKGQHGVTFSRHGAVCFEA